MREDRPSAKQDVVGCRVELFSDDSGVNGSREIFPRVHRIESVVAFRRIHQYFLAGEIGLLVDAGEPWMPEATLFPYLASVGIPAERIELAVATHADTDHHGGFPAIQRRTSARLGCGASDRTLIEEPSELLGRRYRAYEDDHGIRYRAEALENLARLNPTTVDITYRGGEVLDLGDGWEVELVATPGHSHGHLAVLDRRHGALYAGDAIHGLGYPDVGGALISPPNYVDVDAYVGTVERIRSLDLRSLHASHWPLLSGARIADFLDDSLSFVRELESAVVSHVMASHGTTLANTIRAVQRAMPPWAHASPMELAYSVEAHLRRQCDRTVVATIPDRRPIVYHPAN